MIEREDRPAVKPVEPATPTVQQEPAVPPDQSTEPEVEATPPGTQPEHD